MRFRHLIVMLAAALLALPVGAQMMGMGPQIPTLSGIWHPVVGSGASYQIVQANKTTNFDFTIVGKEDMGGKTGYWVETSAQDPRGGGGEFIIKMLQSVDGNTVTHTKTVMQMPGQPPMEMDADTMNMAGRRAPQNLDADFRSKAELVGTESVTVPAGTYSCEHYRMKDGSGDAWISDKVIPWSLVKMTDKGRTVVLAKVITDAKDRITGTPVKFDPMQMMRNRTGQQQ
jgi:hypothetical protein